KHEQTAIGRSCVQNAAMAISLCLRNAPSDTTEQGVEELRLEASNRLVAAGHRGPRRGEGLRAAPPQLQEVPFRRRSARRAPTVYLQSNADVKNLLEESFLVRNGSLEVVRPPDGRPLLAADVPLTSRDRFLLAQRLRGAPIEVVQGDPVPCKNVRVH